MTPTTSLSYRVVFKSGKQLKDFRKVLREREYQASLATARAALKIIFESSGIPTTLFHMGGVVEGMSEGIEALLSDLDAQ